MMRPRVHRSFFIPAIRFGTEPDDFRLVDASEGRAVELHKSLPNAWRKIDDRRRATARNNEAMVLHVDVMLCDQIFRHTAEQLHARYERAELQMMRWGARVQELKHEMAGTAGGDTTVDRLAFTPTRLLQAAVEFARHIDKPCPPECDAERRASAGMRYHAPGCARGIAGRNLKAECQFALDVHGTDVPT